MKLYKSDKIRFIAGLIIIVVIYSLYNIYFMDNYSVLNIDRKLKHIIKFSTTILVYVAGTYHLGKLEDSWMSSLWHLVHITGLCIITSIGLFDWLITEVSEGLKAHANTIQEILISPVLYVAMGVLNNALNRKSAS